MMYTKEKYSSPKQTQPKRSIPLLSKLKMDEGGASQPPLVLLLFALLGLASLLKTSKSLLKWTYANFIRPPKDLKRQYGSWALITGPTDGIGKAIAFELARRGHNLVLVARNKQKLEGVVKEIEGAARAVKIKAVTFDLRGDAAEGCARIEEAIEGLDVGLLVNNAGTTHPFEYFGEVGTRVWENVVKVNVEGTSWVTKVVMKTMVERGRGAILNIGSGSACAIPSFPLCTVYAASKAFIDKFSRCLYVEYKNQGIDVQCQVPFYVSTKMTSMRPSFFVPSADAYARAALRWIGYEPRCMPYWTHSVLWCLLSMFPESVIDNFCLRTSLNVRKKDKLRAARKKEQ